MQHVRSELAFMVVHWRRGDRGWLFQTDLVDFMGYIVGTPMAGINGLGLPNGQDKK